jgi:hypothetical protein
VYVVMMFDGHCKLRSPRSQQARHSSSTLSISIFSLALSLSSVVVLLDFPSLKTVFTFRSDFEAGITSNAQTFLSF